MAKRNLSDAELAAAFEDDNDVMMDMSDEDIDSGDDRNYDPSETDSDCESDRSWSNSKNSKPALVVATIQTTPIPTLTPISMAIQTGPIPTTTQDASIQTASTTRDFQNIVWTDPVGRQQHFPFTGKYGMDPTISGILALAEPIDYYSLFLTQEIVQIMVNETNLYATKILENANDITPSSRLHDWTPTDVDEMKQFIGLLGWMGIKFIANFKSPYTPGEKICIDETMVPFTGREYIPTKGHGYSIKRYKLCTEKGYTWNVSIYVSRDLTDDLTQTASHNVTLKLIEDLLGEGRTLYMDNFYTSVPLAYDLLKQKTHLVGTLRFNRKYIPQEVKDAKLVKGAITAKESPEGVTVLKWRDKRDVQILSTCHLGTETVVTRNKQKTEKIKPKCIVDYDSGKSPVDVSDQLASHSTALRRCNKWYRKLMIELIWSTTLVNAHFLYNLNSVNNAMNITSFRQNVICSLLEDYVVKSSARRHSANAVHHLVTHEQEKRARCASCYNLMAKKEKWLMGCRRWHLKLSPFMISVKETPIFVKFVSIKSIKHF
ncbi:hypothetical protein NQ314_015284 [Rhamnusium bicolor]|uniref:PiggyBac transposable element-derived protein domain-containing protein n=1 Tax=Rhamnusium bicolor TaxID=1586634 RepID=A0AAV8WZS1_9CUCU|nr:hypothetical protein NQ314_015284 [Rhamnusium bicolor]